MSIQKAIHNKKGELQGFHVSQCTEEQKSFELSKLLRIKGALNDLEMLCNSYVLEAWRHYVILKPLVIVDPKRQVSYVICTVANLTVLCNIV